VEKEKIDIIMVKSKRALSEVSLKKSTPRLSYIEGHFGGSSKGSLACKPYNKKSQTRFALSTMPQLSGVRSGVSKRKYSLGRVMAKLARKQ
jgi:hypothetical protein